MTAWLEPVIPHLKALHVALLAVWTAGLLALPRMLSRPSVNSHCSNPTPPSSGLQDSTDAC